MSIVSIICYIVATWGLVSIGSGVVAFFQEDIKFPKYYWPSAVAVAVFTFIMPAFLLFTKIQTIRGKNV